MADTETRQSHTNATPAAAAPARTPTHTPTRTNPYDFGSDTGTTVKLSTPTHRLLRECRERSGKRNDAVIRKALRLLSKELPERVETDDEWADS